MFPEPLRGARTLRALAILLVMLGAAGSMTWFFVAEREPAFVGRASGATLDKSAPPVRPGALALLDTALTEFRRGRRDSAVAALRRLLQTHPKARPDSTTTPPALNALYDSVRSTLHGVARIRSTNQGVELSVVAFTPHRLGVGVETGGGTPLMELFDGVVRESVTVAWDGVRTDGTLAPAGAYNLVLIAFTESGTIAKAVRFPVTMGASTAERSGRPRAVDSTGR